MQLCKTLKIQFHNLNKKFNQVFFLFSGKPFLLTIDAVHRIEYKRARRAAVFKKPAYQYKF